MSNCETCRFDGTTTCTSCGPDLGNYQSQPTDADLQTTAHQVEERARQLLNDVDPDEDKNVNDPKFIKRCLDSNERGDGVLFATLQHGKLLYNVSVRDPKKEIPWYTWSGHVWQRDYYSSAFARVEEAALKYQAQADHLKDEIRKEEITDKKAAGGWKISLKDKYQARADRLRSENGINKALKFAPIVDTTMAKKEDFFNQQPWLLPCKNGVINLQTGNLEQGRPEDLMTISLNLDYDQHADYSLWDNFIKEVADDAEIAAFIKRSLGYAITGFSHEQFFWIFVGKGRNGKGVMFDLISDVLGDYYHEISRSMLIQQRNEPGPNQASEHIHSLLNKRIILGSETNKGQKIDGGAIKNFTGDDWLKCRPNFKSEIRFKPTHTLFLQTNNIPAGITKDFALRQRILKIDFPWMYVDDPAAEAQKNPAKAQRFKTKDKNLKDKLRKTKPGILRWLVEGCLEWQQQGLNPPDSITKGVEELAKEEDYLGQFIEDCLEQRPGAEHLRIKAPDLYKVFSWWWMNNMGNKDKYVPDIRTITGGLRDRSFKVEKRGGIVQLFEFLVKDEIRDEVYSWKK